MKSIESQQTISLLAEVPEALHESVLSFLKANPGWDSDRVFSAALSLFLLQHGGISGANEAQSYRRAARCYLDSIFQAKL